jgi:A/G-specific adenine glycosylase
MLQQTQVSRVLPKYKEFLKEFPTLEKLAKAPNKKLLKVWAGLGYWRRAKYLKKAAKIITKRAKTADLTRRVGPRAKRGVKREEKTQFERFSPRNPEQLEKLPGVGHYTARALACFAFGNNEAFLDTNIRRVYLHFFFPHKKNVSDKEILKIAQRCLYSISHDRRKQSITAREWHYALFDYGAMVLKDKKINKQSKYYHKQSKFEGSFRSFRTKVIKFLLVQPKNRASCSVLLAFAGRELLKQKSRFLASEILDSLLRDHLIKKSKTYYSF